MGGVEGTKALAVELLEPPPPEMPAVEAVETEVAVLMETALEAVPATELFEELLFNSFCTEFILFSIGLTGVDC